MHIDELRPVEENVPNTVKLFEHSIGELFLQPAPPGYAMAPQRATNQQGASEGMNPQQTVPMDVDVVEEEGNQMDWEGENVGGLVSPAVVDPVLDTSMFVHKCLQAAAAMIKDDDGNHSRTTKRVHVLFELLDGPAAG